MQLLYITGVIFGDQTELWNWQGEGCSQGRWLKATRMVVEIDDRCYHVTETDRERNGNQYGRWQSKWQKQKQNFYTHF